MVQNSNVILRKRLNELGKSFKRKRLIFVILCLIASLSVVGFHYVNRRSPITRCATWGFAPANAQVSYTHPERVVVRPWRGQHHIYGIFQIPGGHLNERMFTVTVPGERMFCGTLSFQGTDAFEGVKAQPGNYLMKGMLNTRIALYLISQGRLEELRQPRYWRVGYVKKNG